MSVGLYLIDTSGMFRILQGELRKAWSDQLAAGVIAVCPIVELEFLYSARSLADRLEKQRLMHDLFGSVPVHEGAYERAGEVQQLLTETGAHRSACRPACSSPRPQNANGSRCCATITTTRMWRR